MNDVFLEALKRFEPDYEQARTLEGLLQASWPSPPPIRRVTLPFAWSTLPASWTALSLSL